MKANLNEKDIKSYILKCFEDAYKSENRPFNFDDISIAYILVKNKNGIYQMLPLLSCPFERVITKVKYRLTNNLYKNFGIIYNGSPEMRLSLDKEINPNFTQACFNYNNHTFYLSIFDDKTNFYENNKSGKCMVAYTYEKLLFTLYHLDADKYKSLSTSDVRRTLPIGILDSWDKFKDLYKQTFNKEIGSDYDIIVSSGITRI